MSKKRRNRFQRKERRYEKKRYHAQDRYNVPCIKLSIDDTIGILSDTHFGSKYAAYDKLAEFYDYMHEMGVRQVFHAGDITDGNLSFSNDVEITGYKEQVKKVIRDYPKISGIDTFAIMGNHDVRYLKTDRQNILSMISAERPDIKDCGKFFARFSDKSKNIKLDLNHPKSLKTYGCGMSYSAEEYLGGIPQTQRPNILVRGHMHQNLFGKKMGVYIFEAGCFINPSKHLIEMGYTDNTVGGWVADLRRNEVGITSIKPDWFQGN